MTTIQDIPLQTIDGADTSLAEYDGKVLLVVNVASKCGLTPQYEGLEKLHESLRDQGFSVLGFPANDFGGQEPGTHEEIVEFCSLNYNVQFPLFAKAPVSGPEKQPLYAALTEAKPEATGDKEAWRERLRSGGRTPTEEPEVVWNFEKFLISRTGEVVGRFAPAITPDDPQIAEAIARELAK